MMYVIKFSTDPRDWVFFDTFESAQRAAGMYSGCRVPELNLTKPYYCGY